MSIDQRFNAHMHDFTHNEHGYIETQWIKIQQFLKDEINITLAAIEARVEMEDIPYNYLEDLRRIIHSYKV